MKIAVVFCVRCGDLLLKASISSTSCPLKTAIHRLGWILCQHCRRHCENVDMNGNKILADRSRIKSTVCSPDECFSETEGLGLCKS